MKVIASANILIQLLWIVAVVFIGVKLTDVFFDELSQPWYSLVAGLFTVITYIVFYYVQCVIKATKDPKVKAASNLRLTINQYEKMEVLFDCINANEMMSDERVVSLLHDIICAKPREWREYCLSRVNDFRPFFKKGKEVFAYCQDEKKYVKGVITNVEFGIEWWYYVVDFSEAISIDNRWPEEKQRLLAKTIVGIETDKIECNSCHYF